MTNNIEDLKNDEKKSRNKVAFIIGTERYESRRIDNQLRGRSGRQEILEHQFFISLQDELMRILEETH